MPIYWFVFAITLLLIAIVSQTQKKKRLFAETYVQNLNEQKISAWQIFLICLPMIFFFGLRSRVGDTGAYYYGFENLQPIFTLENLDDRAYGYSIVQLLFKFGISENVYAWFTFLVIASITPIAYILSKYSTNVFISFFVFFASTEFTFLINGTRQFLAVCICFYAFRYIVERNPVKYYIFVSIAISCHLTAIVMLFAYFLVRSKPWSFKMWLIIVAAVLACVFSEKVFGFMDDAFISNSVYAHYSTIITERQGVNIIRVLVNFIPVILAFLYRKKIEAQNCTYINFCINLSILNAMCFLFASTMGANLTGRIAEYFTIFNLILYPYLFTHIFNKNENSIIKPLFYTAYLAFFYYQMVITWGGLEYVSYKLGISY